MRSVADDLATMIKGNEQLWERYGEFMHFGGPWPEGAGVQIEQTAADAERGSSAVEMAAVAGMPATTEIAEPPAAVDG